jgi:hypothetical protein
MLKLVWMEDPVKRVFSLEFIGPCHIDPDVTLVSTESSPDFSTTLAEGDSRAPISSQQEMGLAKRSADHLNRESRSVVGLAAFPKRTFHSRMVVP